MADPDIEALRAEVAALREEIANLQRDLHRAQARVDLTMRGQLRCPVCGKRRIAHAPRVLDRADTGKRALGIYEPKWWSDETAGELELYACLSCGHAEWWVHDPATLTPHKKHLHILDGDAPPSDPYR